MPLITKPNYNQIFASQAPDIDKPPLFNNPELGWAESRSNNGKPTIKQFNYLLQMLDLKSLWILQNGACLPYDATIEYASGSLSLKDGIIQQYNGTTWTAYRNETPYTLKYFATGTSYPANAEITLTNGDKIKNVSGGSLTNDPNVDMTGWIKVNAASQIFDESGKNQQQVNDEIFKIGYANYVDLRKYNPIIDHSTDNTAVVLQALSDLPSYSTLYIPFGVKWDNLPDNVYPSMKDYSRIIDESGYDARYPSVWHNHVMIFNRTTDNTGATNGNGYINRGEYHPYFALNVDCPDGSSGSRGSLVIRQDGEDFQFGSDKTVISTSCLHVSTYGEVVGGSKALRIGTQKSVAPHSFSFNSQMVAGVSYILGKLLRAPSQTEEDYLASHHNIRVTQQTGHTGNFIKTWLVGTVERFRQTINNDGSLSWRGNGTNARLNFGLLGELSGYVKKTRVGNISTPIGADDSHLFMSNFGATGTNTVSLPAPKAGYYLEISVDTAQNVIVAPSTGTNFIGLLAGKTKTSNTVGSKLKITGLNNTTWSFEQVGTWNNEI